MKRLVRDTLVRLGWAGPLAHAYRRATSAAERQRHKAIAQDFSLARQQWSGWAFGGGGGKVVWILSSLSSPWAYKLEGALAAALRFQGYHAVVVAPDYDPWRFRYHGLFGSKRFIDFRRWIAAASTSRSLSLEPFSTTPTAHSLLQVRSQGVDTGRVALSNILYRNKFSKFDPRRPETQRAVADELRQVDRNVRAAQRLIAVERPDLALVLEKGISPIAEVAAALIAADVPLIHYGHSHHANGYVLKRNTGQNLHVHPFSLSPETWEKARGMRWDDDRKRRLLKELDEEYLSGRWFNRKLLHSGKSFKTPDEVRRQLGLDPAKKTAVIFSHVLWDATFFYGKGLFEDYETWLIETVRAAAKNPHLNWVVKLHPDLVWKMRYERQTGELRDLKLIADLLDNRSSHVKVVPPETDIDTFSFFGITDYCLTVRGTIGIEMSCRGVPVITAGTGRYTGYGFTIDSDTPEAYLRRVESLHTQPPLSPGQAESAQRFAYVLFKARPWMAKSFSFIRAGLDSTGDPLDHNIVPRAGLADPPASAEDLQAFARWAASSQTDYLEETVL